MGQSLVKNYVHIILARRTESHSSIVTMKRSSINISVEFAKHIIALQFKLEAF